MRTFPVLALLGAARFVQSQQSSTVHPDPIDAVVVNPKLLYRDTLDIEKRANGSCSPMPTGHGPVPDPDTSYEFLNSDAISNLAKNASTPSGYHRVFIDLHASSSAGDFLGYSSMDSYDTEQCATQCNQEDGCQAFNIFIERSPTVSVGSECPNPPSTSIIKCALWGSAVDKANTNNAGYTDNSFVVAIAGSNGYVQGEGSDAKG